MGRHRDLSLPIRIYNCYAPYVDRQRFWISLEASGLLDLDGIILVGDLNLTLHAREIWGPKAREDSLQPWFRSFLMIMISLMWSHCLLVLLGGMVERVMPLLLNGWTISWLVSLCLVLLIIALLARFRLPYRTICRLLYTFHVVKLSSNNPLFTVMFGPMNQPSTLWFVDIGKLFTPLLLGG